MWKWRRSMFLPQSSAMAGTRVYDMYIYIYMYIYIHIYIYMLSLFHIACFICMLVFLTGDAGETVCSSESPFSMMPIIHNQENMTPTVRFDRMHNTADWNGTLNRIAQPGLCVLCLSLSLASKAKTIPDNLTIWKGAAYKNCHTNLFPWKRK